MFLPTSKIRGRAGREPSLLARLGDTREHALFLEAIARAEVTADLAGGPPWTVLAPFDAAFACLDPIALRALFAPAELEALIDLVEHHLVRGDWALARAGAPSLRSVFGEALSVEVLPHGRLRVGGAEVLASMPCENGALYVIDRVLVPSGGAAAELLRGPSARRASAA